MSIARLVQPKYLLLLFLAAFFGALAAGWARGGLTDQELLANYAKAMDYARGFKGAGGWPWWTEFFNSGQSQAPALGTLFAYLPLILFSPLGPWLGSKAVVLIFGAASGLAMFAFAKALTRCEWTALGCAILYMICPQFALRAAWNEHLVVVFCFLYPPLMCWALLRLSQRPSTGASLVLGVSTAAMFLTYAKIALVFMPALFLFAFWLWWARRENGRNFWKGVLKGVGVFIVLGGLPILPALHEKAGLALFEFDPLEAWKHAFSVHTPLSLLDRGGFLSEGLPAGLVLDRAGTYVGIVVIVGLGWILFRRKAWSRSSPEADPLRIFLAMALLLFWFSVGPDGLLVSFWKLLGNAQKIKDWVAPLLWLALLLPGFLMARFWPWARSGISLVFLVLILLAFYLVPGFRLFEEITRIHDIRAPWSFWQVGGSFAVAMVGGLCLPPLFQALPTKRGQRLLGLVLMALALLDAAAYEKEFFKPGLEPELAEDFREAQQYLAGAPVEGSVLPVSGRYFYLMTPEMSGRALAMEAFQSYLMPRYTKRLMNATAGSPEMLRGYLKNAGIAYVLLDRSDRDVDKDTEKFFRDLLPVSFENKNFVLLENKGALAPAFFSAQVVLVPDGDGFEDEILSKSGLRNFLAIPVDVDAATKDWPGVAGKLNPIGEGEAEFQMEDAYRTSNGAPFRRLETGSDRKNPQRISLKADLASAGWITVPESFHGDWRAELNGKPVAIHRGMGAFLSVPVGAGVQSLNFSFEPPFWYWVCAWVAAFGWVLATGTAVLVVFSHKTRESLFGEGGWGGLPVEAFAGRRERSGERAAIQRALVVVPCYNEAVSIAETLDKILQHPVTEVLVVDDASPDGTAKIVETLPEFGRRIHLLRRTGKLGLASAYKEGFAWGLQRDFGAILEMDADLSHDPADISRLITALDEGADMAIGSRYLDGVRVLNWAQHRLFLSLFAGSYTRFFTALPLTDPTSGFKAIRREVLESMDWNSFAAEGYGFQIELHVRAWRLNFVLKEIPIVFTERRAGASKMSRQIALEAAVRVIELAFEKREGKSL